MNTFAGSPIRPLLCKTSVLRIFKSLLETSAPNALTAHSKPSEVCPRILLILLVNLGNITQSTESTSRA